MKSKSENVIRLKRKPLDPEHREKLSDNPEILSICEKATSIGMEVIGVYDQNELDSMPLDKLPPGLFEEQFKKRNKAKE